MKNIIRFPSVALFIISLLSFSSNVSAQDYYKIEFTFIHSMRIPYHYVKIDIIRRNNAYTLKLHSEPSDTNSEWNYSKADTSFSISQSQFDAVFKAVKEISCSDISNNDGGIGFDGDDCTISSGNLMSSVSYNVWSPDYNTKARHLSDFFITCKLIIETAGLDPDVIFSKKNAKH